MWIVAAEDDVEAWMRESSYHTVMGSSDFIRHCQVVTSKKHLHEPEVSTARDAERRLNLSQLLKCSY